ncbi:aspartic proteinase CDR1-like [Triticum dicoccoides]|uniref:aspartic proteinase CDR1-like n=1 Tax=Triticum dicoccoides TaxID=85692 RepID=UPI001891140B|nr:aspartic proteinase CDR1-like [Triticum dicoccoides]
MPGTTISGVLLLACVVLAVQLCVCTELRNNGSRGDDGFSVEFIHRDSVRSPFHDPSLTAHGRVLAAARRSTARARVIDDGTMSEVDHRSFEYLMAVGIGTPPTRMLAIADTGSDLVWFNCRNGTGAAAVDRPPSVVLFDPDNSTTFGLVGCKSRACRAIPDGATCTLASNCKYIYSYGDGSRTSGLISTETFTFAHVPGTARGHRGRRKRVATVNFGCSTATAGTFQADGVVGLGGGALSLVTQLGAHKSLGGRKFSYCLVPYSVNASSALNFGARAIVKDTGAVTTPLIPSLVDTYYTVDLQSVKIGNMTIASPHGHQDVIVDSGTTLTFLNKALLDPMVKELSRRIKLPRAPSPDKLLTLCFDVSRVGERRAKAMVPDVTLGLGGGAAVTLNAENTFVVVEEGTMCLAVSAVPERLPASILGNIAQQNMHVGYDLDKRTVTFAAANCAASYHVPIHPPPPM